MALKISYKSHPVYVSQKDAISGSFGI